LFVFLFPAGVVGGGCLHNSKKRVVPRTWAEWLGGSGGLGGSGASMGGLAITEMRRFIYIHTKR